MTCNEIREYLIAFLDNEVDAALSMEVQRHLERCSDCAREAEIERTVLQRLPVAMGLSFDGAEAADATLRSMLDRAVARRAFRFGRRQTAVLVGAAAGIALAVFWIVGHSQIDRASQSRFADLLVADFDHFLGEGRPVQIASADRGKVSQWLRGKTGLAVTLPATKGVNCKLIGARKCKLNGQPAAFASYEMDATPACLVVLAGGPDTLANMKRVSRDGRTFWVDRSKDHFVVACQKDDLIYAAVSRVEKDELLHCFLSESE